MGRRFTIAIVGFLCLLMMIAAEGEAQNRRANRTIKECAQDLSREVFLSLNYKQSEKFCKNYSQRAIDCATQLAQAQRLTYSKFEQALADCNRVRNPEPPNTNL